MVCIIFRSLLYLQVLFSLGSKESAVMFAMVSAGMTQSITTELQKEHRETSSGSINGCNQPSHIASPYDYIALSDCEQDLNIASRYSQRILKYWDPNLKSSGESLMNAHNTAVGRMVGLYPL